MSAPVLLILLACSLPRGDRHGAAEAAHAWERGERALKDNDLEKSERYLATAVSLSPPDDPYRDAYLARLAYVRALAPVRTVVLPTGAEGPVLDRHGDSVTFELGDKVGFWTGLGGTPTSHSFAAPVAAAFWSPSPGGDQVFGFEEGGGMAAADSDGRLLARWTEGPRGPGTFIGFSSWTGHIHIAPGGKITWDDCAAPSSACVSRTADGPPGVLQDTPVAAVAPSGTLITLESTDRTWDGRPDATAVVAHGTTGSVRRIAFPRPISIINDIRFGLDPAADGEAAVVDVGAEVWLADFRKGAATELYSADRSEMLVASADVHSLENVLDGAIALLDSVHDRSLARRPLFGGNPLALIPESGTYVVFEDGALKTYAIASAQPIHTWQLESSIAAAALEGDLLVYAASDGLHRRDLQSGQDLTLPLPISRIDSVGLEPGAHRMALTAPAGDGKSLWLGQLDGTADAQSVIANGILDCRPIPNSARVYCWLGGLIDVAAGEEIPLNLYDHALCADGRHIVGDDGMAVGYRLVSTDGRYIHIFGSGGRTLLMGVCEESDHIDETAPDGPRFWLRGGGSVVFTEDGAVRTDPTGETLPLELVPDGIVSVSPDARWAIVHEPVEEGAPTRLFSTLTGTAISFDLPHASKLLTSGFSADSRLFYTLDDGGMLEEWATVPGGEAAGGSVR